jgi:hypothetical protein
MGLFDNKHVEEFEDALNALFDFIDSNDPERETVAQGIDDRINEAVEAGNRVIAKGKPELAADALASASERHVGKTPKRYFIAPSASRESFERAKAAAADAAQRDPSQDPKWPVRQKRWESALAEMRDRLDRNSSPIAVVEPVTSNRWPAISAVASAAALTATLFLPWFEGGGTRVVQRPLLLAQAAAAPPLPERQFTAWEAFSSWDVVLLAIGLVAGIYAAYSVITNHGTRGGFAVGVVTGAVAATGIAISIASPPDVSARHFIANPVITAQAGGGPTLSSEDDVETSPQIGASIGLVAAVALAAASLTAAWRPSRNLG